MLYPKESEYTNITCNICRNKIAYEYVSFMGDKCSYNNLHPTQYTIKCSKCKTGYGPWKEFNKKLFPGYNIDQCHCFAEFRCTRTASKCKITDNDNDKCETCKNIHSNSEYIEELYNPPNISLAYSTCNCSIFRYLFPWFVNKCNFCISLT